MRVTWGASPGNGFWGLVASETYEICKGAVWINYHEEYVFFGHRFFEK